MMKTAIIPLLFLFTHAYSFSDKIEVNKVRALYNKSVTDVEACKKMISILSSVEEKKPVLSGYEAIGQMMMAKYVANPFSKLVYFNKGKQMLEAAIEVDKKNIELRFLRFMAQVNAPSFLGYNANIESDKVFILNTISTMEDPKSREFLAITLSKSNYLTAAEKRALNY